MPTVNLRDFYPYHYSEDEYVEVSEAVMEELKADQRYHKSHRLRMYRNKSYYSLDCNDGIENAALYVEPSPESLYLWKEEIEELCAALNSLGEIQGRRVDAYYLEGLKYRQIAEREGVSPGSISTSVKAGLKKMKAMLE